MTTPSTLSASTGWEEPGEPWQRGSFAEKAVNAAGADGLFFGNSKLFLVQLMLVIIVPLFAATMTWIIFKAVDALVGMRVDKKDEIVGLDLTQQSESAYTVIE